MSNYRRLISYIYAYEGKKKGKNIGFVKLEAREGQCKLNANVKKVYVEGNDIGVYLLGKEGQETFLSNIFIRSGCGEFRTVLDARNVMGTGNSLDTYYGLTIHDVKNPWRSYTTIWEDSVAHMAQEELPGTADRSVPAKQAVSSVVKEIESEIAREEHRKAEEGNFQTRAADVGISSAAAITEQEPLSEIVLCSDQKESDSVRTGKNGSGRPMEGGMMRQEPARSKNGQEPEAVIVDFSRKKQIQQRPDTQTDRRQGGTTEYRQGLQQGQRNENMAGNRNGAMGGLKPGAGTSQNAQPGQRNGLSSGMQTGQRNSMLSGAQPGQRNGQSSGMQSGQRNGMPSGLQSGQRNGMPSGIQPGQRNGQSSGMQPGQRNGLQSGLQPGVESDLKSSPNPGERSGETAGPNSGQNSMGRPGPQPGPNHGGRPGQQPGPYPGPKPGPRPGPQPGPKPGPQPGSKPGPQPGPQPGSKPGPQPGPMPGPKPGPHPGPQPGPYPGPKPGPQPGPMPGPKPGPQPGPIPGPKPGPQPGPKPGPNPGPRPGIFPPFFLTHAMTSQTEARMENSQKQETSVPASQGNQEEVKPVQFHQDLGLPEGFPAPAGNIEGTELTGGSAKSAAETFLIGAQKPMQSDQTDKRGQSMQPGQLTQPAQVSGSNQISQSAQLSQSNEISQSAQLSGSNQISQSAQLSQSNEISQSAQPSQSNQMIQPDQSDAGNQNVIQNEQENQVQAADRSRLDDQNDQSQPPDALVSPELENPEVLKYLQETEELTQNPEKLWEALRKSYPKIQPFDYDEGCEILTIRPQDIGRLPREVWMYGNNSFLLHGYYNFRYLILVRLGNSKGKPRYLLGIPGHYYSNEKYMASMFGFPNFVLSKKQPSNDGRFGYWYTDIRMG